MQRYSDRSCNVTIKAIAISSCNRSFISRTVFLPSNRSRHPKPSQLHEECHHLVADNNTWRFSIAANCSKHFKVSFMYACIRVVGDFQQRTAIRNLNLTDNFDTKMVAFGILLLPGQYLIMGMFWLTKTTGWNTPSPFKLRHRSTFCCINSWTIPSLTKEFSPDQPATMRSFPLALLFAFAVVSREAHVDDTHDREQVRELTSFKRVNDSNEERFFQGLADLSLERMGVNSKRSKIAFRPSTFRKLSQENAEHMQNAITTSSSSKVTRMFFRMLIRDLQRKGFSLAHLVNARKADFHSINWNSPSFSVYVVLVRIKGGVLADYPYFALLKELARDGLGVGQLIETIYTGKRAGIPEVLRQSILDDLMRLWKKKKTSSTEEICVLNSIIQEAKQVKQTNADAIAVETLLTAKYYNTIEKFLTRKFRRGIWTDELVLSVLGGTVYLVSISSSSDLRAGSTDERSIGKCSSPQMLTLTHSRLSQQWIKTSFRNVQAC
ncbi:uncharacterized protein PHALS_00457 [Plasmopara halstedii]|uniref:Uncharacterized protein n=1 Tax=Plasmopara halstedii TaxID=4781 RepID=A0A0N7L3K6_PLAHL|nr:uncharacterized protein PHALS_00457 [Plasmopara halstedii]CEG36139.1 hypothetical protein PHALS_00457 [Plasmopara halstedii]|eukprot:XP_024572508.1 hypothetical protein PHALS_00457 [Plasmopara halstedii]